MSEAAIPGDNAERDHTRSASPNEDGSAQKTQENANADINREEDASPTADGADNEDDIAGIDGEEDDVEVIIQNEGGGKLTFAAKQVPGARYNRIERIHLPTNARGSDPGFERSVFEELDIPIPDDIALPHPEQITLFDVPLSSYRSKPWDLPGANISDWFNFGLNSATWDRYRIRQRRIRKELTGILDARIANAESSNRLKQSKGLETPTAPDSSLDTTDSLGTKRARPESFPPPPAFPMPPPILSPSGPNMPPASSFLPPVRPGSIPLNPSALLQPPAQAAPLVNPSANVFPPPPPLPNPAGMMPPVMPNPNMQPPFGFPPVNPGMNPSMQPGLGAFQANRR